MQIRHHPWSIRVGFLVACLLLSLVIPSSSQQVYGPPSGIDADWMEHSYAHSDDHGSQPDSNHHQSTSGSRGSPSASTPPAVFPNLGSLVSSFLQPQSGQDGRSMSMISSLASFLPLLLSSRDGSAPGGSNHVSIPEILRMVGVDSNKIGTMVINAIVYVIELVSNHFFGGSNSIESRKLDFPGSFLLSLFDTRRAEKFLRTISNPDYPTNIINNLKKATGNDTVCIQQLICKMAPFWWGVNRSVRDLLPLALGKSSTKSPLLKMGWKNLLTKYVPSIKEFTDNSDICESRYGGCIVMAFQQAHAHNNNNNNNNNNNKQWRQQQHQ